MKRVALTSVVLLVACNGLLGIEEATVRQDAGVSSDAAPEGGDAAIDGPVLPDAPSNACGHDCLGAACNVNAHVCEPTRLGQSSNLCNPTSIAIDDTTAYWTNTGTSGTHNADALILSTLKDGTGGTLTHPISGRDDCQGISLSNTQIFWTFEHGGQVCSIPKSAGTSAGIGPLSAQRTWVDRDAGVLYFSIGPANLIADIGGMIMSTPEIFDASAPTFLGGTHAADRFFQSFAIVGSRWFAVDRYSTSMDAGTGKLVVGDFCPQNNCVEVSLPGAQGYGAVTGDAQGVFWTSRDEGIIRALDPKPQDVSLLSAKQLLTNLVSPMEITSDDARVYWTTDSGEVWRADRDGKNQLLLATGHKHPLGLAVDAQYVYWVDRGTPALEAGAQLRDPADPDAFDLCDGSVWRVAK